MTDYVELSSDGLFICRWNRAKKEYVRYPIREELVLTCLRHPCQIKEGTTLKDIFRAVAKYDSLREFISQYSWCQHIDEFHAQAEEPMRTEGFTPLDFLEICRGCVYDGGDVCDFFLKFQGIGNQQPDSFYKSENGKDLYSVSYSPMYDLADVPVKLNEELVIYKPWKFCDGESNVLLRARCGFSFLEVLDAIYDDISFHGGPQENAEFLEEMQERVREIKDELESKDLSSLE